MRPLSSTHANFALAEPIHLMGWHYGSVKWIKLKLVMYLTKLLFHISGWGRYYHQFTWYRVASWKDSLSLIEIY